MKRIGLLSDTHSCWDDRYAKYFKECDEIWHAGDIGCVDTLRRLGEIVPVVRAVRGNIDSGEVSRQLRDVEIFEVEGAKVLLTHIGGYPGRYAPGIERLLRDNGITIWVSGHSHILRVMRDPKWGCLHINPGAAGNTGWHTERTLIRFSIDKGIPCDLDVVTLGTRLRPI